MSEILNWIKTDRPLWYDNTVIFTQHFIDYPESDFTSDKPYQKFNKTTFDEAIMNLDWWEEIDSNMENYGVYSHCKKYPAVDGDEEFFKFNIQRSPTGTQWNLKIKELTEYIERLYANANQLPNDCCLTLNFWCQNIDAQINSEWVFTFINLKPRD